MRLYMAPRAPNPRRVQMFIAEKGIRGMAQGLREVAAQPDPVGEITDLKFRPSGIQVGRMRVPLGVIGIIYESRPNVTADAAALCLKAGNACILRGGSEAARSNRAIAACIAPASAKVRRSCSELAVPCGRRKRAYSSISPPLTRHADRCTSVRNG